MTQPNRKIEVDAEVVRLMAMDRAMGVYLRDISKKHGFSVPVVSRTLSGDMAKSIIKGIVDDSVSAAVIAVRRKLADMTELAMQVIEDQLKEGNLEAVKIYFKGLGIDTVEKKDPNQAQSITVILPGKQPEKEVKSDVKDLP